MFSCILSRNFASIAKDINKLIDFSKVPRLNPNDIVEKVSRGSGPGGQSVNKSLNAISLSSHEPTGVRVKCHETRSTEKNRQLAHKKLVTAVDNFINGEESVLAQRRRIALEREERNALSRKRKREEKLKLKAEAVAKVSEAAELEMQDGDEDIREETREQCPTEPPQD